MASPFAFSPVTGINDATQFPDDDPQIRSHLQALLDQIKTYINNYTGQSTNNLTGNGYQKFPDGLIIQWGGLSVSTGIGVTFPIAFPNACLKVFSQVASNDGKVGGVVPNATTKTGFTAYVAGATTGDYRWYDYFAIGY
jgi:hypothetical protein